ncbi:MAG: type II toxin-antitoxin system death-on-curing family toxin [Candidatus Pacebacteria bacterium]|nr:type II toxin-antitoxin system death-on-curing family toxin [Candidatus Paceibacterota bacterium]
MIEILSIIEVEAIAFELARELLSFDEHIPEFSTRFPNVLESCLLTPFQTFSKKPLYKGLLGKAAILFYLLIKNHPFQNGNKRIAITALLAFFYKNKKWLEVDTKEFYNFAIWVAQSPRQLKDETVMAIEKFLKTHTVSLK